MFNFKTKGFRAIFILFVFIVHQSKAKSLNDFEIRDGNLKEKKLVKRGHIGVENDFGPPLTVSSSVLQLGKGHEIESYEPSEHFIISDDDETSWQKPTISNEHLPIWNEIHSGWEEPPKVLKISADHLWPETDLHSKVYSYEDGKEHFGLSGGLHTQIIGSSGHGISDLSDKIDSYNGFGEEGKHFIKSYG